MKYFISIIFVIIFHSAIAQTNERISVEFNNTPLPEAIEMIESQSDLKFYFINDWIEGVLVNGSFNNQPVSVVLEAVLNETVLNFYMLDQEKIVLTQNTKIYDELPEGFIPSENENSDIQAITTETNRPVFNPSSKVQTTSPIATVRIGKASANNNTVQSTIRGILKDENGKPAADVAITIKALQAITVSDENGFYELEVPNGTHMLSTSSLTHGDLTVRIVVFGDGELDLTLPENLEQLDEVYLESDAKKNISNPSTGVTRIETDEIKTIPLVLGERDILKVATTLPGISNAGEGSSGYNVRGGKEDQNLIILDEGVIYNPTHFFGIFSGINPFTTEEALIYKGNIPAEYGGRLSSVVELTTKEAAKDKIKGEGSIGPVTSGLSLEFPLKKEESAILVAGRSTYSNWILRSLDEESLRNSRAYFYDGLVKYDQKVNDKNELHLTAYYSKDGFSITSDSLYNYSNRMLSANWKYQLNNNNTIDFIVTHSGYRFGIEYDGPSNTDFRLGSNISETQFKTKGESKLNEQHRLAYGLAFKLYSVLPGEIEPINGSSTNLLEIPKEQGLESALFITDDFLITEKLLLSAGFRLSVFSALGPSTERFYAEGQPLNESSLIEEQDFSSVDVITTYLGPEFRLSGRYSFTPDFSIKGSFNTTYQYLHTLTNNTTVSPIDTYALSDINIKPQRAQQYSVGLFQNLKEDEYELSLEGYYKQSRNILDFKTGASLFLNEAIETEVLQGEGKSYGIELLARKSKGRLNGWVGYTYSRSLIKFDSEFTEERINNGEFFPSNYDKPHDFSLVANYKFTKRFSCSANFVYQTGRPVTIPVGNFEINNSEFVLYSDRNEFRIPDFYRLDLSFNVEGNHKIKKLAHSFWNISIYNVLGRNNPYSVFFVNEDGQVKAYQSSIFAIPIPTITYNFKF